MKFSEVVAMTFSQSVDFLTSDGKKLLIFIRVQESIQQNTNIPIVGIEPTSLAMPDALHLSYMGFRMRLW